MEIHTLAKTKRLDPAEAVRYEATIRTNPACQRGASCINSSRSADSNDKGAVTWQRKTSNPVEIAFPSHAGR
jgi:hypothetical protein